GWSVDHSFFVTNTFQQQTRTGESLIIDVENYYYLLDFSFRSNQWIFQSSLPLIANRPGQLDGLIENWHDFFGLPGGKRESFPRDEINLEYTRDGNTVFSENNDSDGIGDIALQIGYAAENRTTWFAAIELPTGSESDLSGNGSTDFSIWVSRQWQPNPLMNTYGLYGISFPADDGALENIVEEYIHIIQLGFDYRFSEIMLGLVQLDYHSETVEDTRLKAFGHSLQLQLGLAFEKLIDAHRLDLFFSEDIQVGSAPDISFGLRLTREF
ncbi:MAG: DUF3187 family protein, partial [Pseudomonadota bacterium]